MIVEILGLILIYYLIDNFYLKRRKLPPGPTPLPIVGNLLSLKRNKIEDVIKHWHQKYGDIMTVWQGNRPVVTLHNSSKIYETFLKDGEAYTGRIATKGMDIFRGGKYGIILTDGDLWREHRRFALHVLRNFGLGKNLMQERILVEVTSMISDIKNFINNNVNDDGIHLIDEIDRSVGSVINALAFGYRFDKEKRHEFFQNKKNLHLLITSISNLWWKIISPYVDIVKHLPYLRDIYKTTVMNGEEIKNFYLNNINEHRRKINFDDDQEPLDYVEAFLRQQHKLNKMNQKNHTFTDEQLYGTVFDLWIAGQETTSTTLGWTFLYLIKYPEIQDKVHQELDRIIGSDRIVTLDDKAPLNYLNAVINESQRMCNLLSFNVVHETTKNVNINGYDIPKGTAITHQISTVLSDERYFKNPEIFNPERFIDEHGRFFSPPEFMPFGIGKRACLGEGLARMELFLFTANIMNQFKLKCHKGIPLDDTRIPRGTTICKPYKCDIMPRFH